MAVKVDICSLFLAGLDKTWLSLTSTLPSFSMFSAIALLPFTFKAVSLLSLCGTTDVSKPCLAASTVAFKALVLAVKLSFSATLLLSSLSASVLSFAAVFCCLAIKLVPFKALSAVDFTAAWLPSVAFFAAASGALPFVAFLAAACILVTASEALIAFCLISCAIALGSFLLVSGADSAALASSFASIFVAASLFFTTVWVLLKSLFTVSALTLLPFILLAKLIPISTLAKPTDNLRKL